MNFTNLTSATVSAIKSLQGFVGSEQRSHHGGFAWMFSFANGFKASVVKHAMSYGGRDGLWELAVLGSEGNLRYDTLITDDVLGFLTEEDVVNACERISQLSTDGRKYRVRVRRKAKS